MRRLAYLILLLVPAVPLAGQGFETLPRFERASLAMGSHLDLDGGLILRSAKQRRIVADLQLDRDGTGIFVRAPHGAVPLKGKERSPPADWTTKRIRIARDLRSRQKRWLVKTNRMSVALVELHLLQEYSAPTAFVTWVRAPESNAVFVEPPKGLHATWHKGTVELSWSATQGSYLVEHHAPRKKPRLKKLKAPTYRFTIENEADLHRIHVRRVLSNGTIGLPASMTLRAGWQPTRRYTLDYPDNWNRGRTGLDVLGASIVADSPDLVFFPYAIYSPRGGLVRLGRGPRTFASTTVLPASGYLPIYDRIDHHDVFALRLADGRHAKLMIEQLGSHTLDPMRLHVTVLPSGIRRLFAPPTNPSFTLKGEDHLVLRWNATPRAVRYRVVSSSTPELSVACTDPRASIGPFAVNRFHELRITAYDARGDASAPLSVTVHTFDRNYRVGRFALDALGSNAFDFAAGQVVKAKAAKANHFDLRITNSAGGASSLTIAGRHGVFATEESAFGRFPEKQRQTAKEIHTDDGPPKRETFCVVTKDGRVASVRIRSRNFPQVEFEYVLRLKR